MWISSLMFYMLVEILDNKSLAARRPVLPIVSIDYTYHQDGMPRNRLTTKKREESDL